MADKSSFHETRILTPHDWDRFKTDFNKHFPGYFAKLHTKYPNLTASEIRLMALLKLHFNIKKIAFILGIAPQSIIKSRYRLKKKLALKDSITLEKISQSI